MKILVTGGAGFIGSHLVEALLEQGHIVWTLDDLSTGQKNYLKDSLSHPHHRFIQGSVHDAGLLRALQKKVDVVYHLAAVLGVKNTVDHPLKVIEGNIEGTKNVLEAAMQHHNKVIFASTSEIYGKNTSLPFHEYSDRVYGTPSTHRWCYATAKSIDEHMCFAYAEKGLPVTILRYFNTYGPRQTQSQYGGVVARFIRAALKQQPLEVYGDGQQTRCFTYVADTVRGTMAAMTSKANGMAINIGSTEQLSIERLAQWIVQLSQTTSPIIKKSYEEAYGAGYEDMPARIPDITRAGKILGYHPTISLRDGLSRTIAWYRQHGEIQ